MKRKNINSDRCVRTYPLIESNLLMLHQLLNCFSQIKTTKESRFWYRQYKNLNNRKVGLFCKKTVQNDKLTLLIEEKISAVIRNRKRPNSNFVLLIVQNDFRL